MEDQNIIQEDFPTVFKANGHSKNSDSHVVASDSVPIKQYTGIKVLMYHRIVNDTALSDHCEFCVHVQEFRRQMEILDKLGFTPVTFHDYDLYTRGALQLPKKPVIITFDDGYLDTYSVAYPILVEYGMRAVVFVLGDRNLKKNKWDAHKEHIPASILMEDHHIQEIQSRGFEIGAHTMSHANLPALPESDAYNEIKAAKLNLESLLGVPVQSFSYPFGLVNDNIKSMTAETGYNFGCGVYSGPPRFGEDYFEIRRITVHNTMSQSEFMMRLLMPIEYVDWMRWKTKNISN